MNIASIEKRVTEVRNRTVARLLALIRFRCQSFERTPSGPFQSCWSFSSSSPSWLPNSYVFSSALNKCAPRFPHAAGFRAGALNLTPQHLYDSAKSNLAGRTCARGGVMMHTSKNAIIARILFVLVPAWVVPIFLVSPAKADPTLAQEKLAIAEQSKSGTKDAGRILERDFSKEFEELTPGERIAIRAA